MTNPMIFIVTDARNGEVIFVSRDKDAATDVWHQSIYFRIFGREA